MERTTDGLTAKVLNERLAKLIRYQLIEKISYAEVPPRVEYLLTPFGKQFVAILDQIERLSEEHAASGNR
jgi:DNA-binding HxlR family transcriptional regulator